MASIPADANIAGTASANAPAQVLFTAGAIFLDGTSDGIADLTGTFGGLADLQASADIVPGAGLTAFVELGLIGQGTFINPIEPIYLNGAQIAGSSATAAVVEMALAAVTPLAGEATTTAAGLMAYEAVAAPSGDADIVVDADMALGAAVAAVGQATVSFAPLGDLEMAADLAGSASMTSAGTLQHAAVALAAGTASVSPHAIVRVHKLPLPPPPEPPLKEERFVGYQPGRESHNISDKFKVVTDAGTLRRRNREASDELATGTFIKREDQKKDGG